jgi:hypothetical protein
VELTIPDFWGQTTPDMHTAKQKTSQLDAPVMRPQATWMRRMLRQGALCASTRLVSASHCGGDIHDFVWLWNGVFQPPVVV